MKSLVMRKYLGIFVVIEPMSHAEVRDNNVKRSLSSNEHVGSTQVSMENSKGVQMVYARHTLLENGDSRGNRNHLLTIKT